MPRPSVEHTGFPRAGLHQTSIKSSSSAAASKSSSVAKSKGANEGKTSLLPYSKCGLASENCNIMSKSNSLRSMTTNTQHIQPTSSGTTASALPTDTTSSILPTLPPPIPPPTILNPALAAVTSVGAGTQQPIFPPFVQFPASHSGPYYYQQNGSSTPAIPLPSSTNYDTRSSVTNDYQQGYFNGISTSSVCGTTSDHSNNGTGILQQLSPSSAARAEAATASIQPQQISLMSPQIISSDPHVFRPMFPPTIMGVPTVPSASISSISCTMSDTINNSMNSNTQLHSLSYNVNQPQVNTSMLFPETNQSFSTDNHHGLPPQHNLPNSYHQTPNAIETPFYNPEREAAYLHGNLGNQSVSVAIDGDCQYQNAINSGATKIHKDKKGSANLYKNNVKKFSLPMTAKNNRYVHGKNKSEDESLPRVTENNDGYTSSVSHSSARLSNPKRSLSSTNGSSKMCKGNLSQQPFVLYQKQPSSKQQKCQSLDRSSDSDFTSHLSCTSSKKQEVPSTMTTCDLCKLNFPSQSVLDNHLKGSRHTRRVKSQQAFRQLQDNGTNLRQNIIQEDGSFDDGSFHFGELSCEVCEVSVNSSHQLQAHLAGKCENGCKHIELMS